MLSDYEAVFEEIEYSLGLALPDDVWQNVEELRCHTDVILVDEQLEHDLESDWALLVQGDVDGGSLLTRRVQFR